MCRPRTDGQVMNVTGVVVLMGLLGAGMAMAATGDAPTTVINTPMRSPIVHLYSGTLSYEWSQFPECAAPGYGQGGTDGHLDVMFPIYLDAVMELGFTTECRRGCVDPTRAVPTPISPPQLLRDQPWFKGVSRAFGISNIYQVEGSGGRACGDEYRPLELPVTGTAPVTPDGKLRVVDFNGGLSGDLAIEIYAEYEGQSGQGGATEVYLIIIRWDRPGKKEEFGTGRDVYAVPGDVVLRDYNVFVNRGCSELCGPYKMCTSVKIFDWASSDIPGISPGFIDAADLAGVCRHLGERVDYGFSDEGKECGSRNAVDLSSKCKRNYEFNVWPYGPSAGIIDSADLALVASRLGESCTGNRFLPDEEVGEILGWFGMERRDGGAGAGPEGGTSPVYRIVDTSQNRRAVLDPHGYKRIASEATWTHIKRLYR